MTEDAKALFNQQVLKLDEALKEGAERIALTFSMDPLITLSYGVTTRRISLELSGVSDLRGRAIAWLRALTQEGYIRDFDGSKPTLDRLLEGNYFAPSYPDISGSPDDDAETVDISDVDPAQIKPTAGRMVPDDWPLPDLTPEDGWELQDHDPVSGRVILKDDPSFSGPHGEYSAVSSFKVCEADGTLVHRTIAEGQGEAFAGSWLFFINGADGRQARISTSDGADDEVIALPAPARTFWTDVDPADVSVPGVFEGDAPAALQAAKALGYRYLVDDALRMYRLASTAAAGHFLTLVNGARPVRWAEDTPMAPYLLHLMMEDIGGLTQSAEPHALEIAEQGSWSDYKEVLTHWINALAPGPVRKDETGRFNGGKSFRVATFKLFHSNPWRHARTASEDADYRDLAL